MADAPEQSLARGKQDVADRLGMLDLGGGNGGVGVQLQRDVALHKRGRARGSQTRKSRDTVIW